MTEYGANIKYRFNWENADGTRGSYEVPFRAFGSSIQVLRQCGARKVEWEKIDGLTGLPIRPGCRPIRPVDAED